jgi:hypothetical protein
LPSNSPQEPTADIRAAASAVRQTFVALVNEGFTEYQALVIIGQILSANGGGSK